MKTPNEIAWNLLKKEKGKRLFTPVYSVSGRTISEITGIDTITLDLLWKKLCMTYFLREMPNGTEIAKQVIDEMETGKPHYEIDIEGIEQNDKSTD